MRFPTLVILVGLVAIGACQRTKTADFVVSCEKHDSLSECNEYTSEVASSRRNYLSKSCSVARGQFREESCRREPAEVGGCELAGERRWMYADGPVPYTVATAQHRCEVIEGTWVPAR